jgi:hypothetical protein
LHCQAIVMAHSSSYLGARLFSLWGAAAILCLVAPGCAAEIVVEGATPGGAGTDREAVSPACSGDDPQSFCDDCNPCTDEANCTPCSTLPPSQQDIYHCTPDEELPGFCIGRTGCVHVPMTTPAGQTASCFPVADAADPHAGVCDAGTCVDDEG